MSEFDSDYDARQYKRMNYYIELFEKDEVSLDMLTKNLWNLVGALQKVDEKWRDEFLDQVGKLYGVVEEVVPKKKESEIVKNAINTLKGLLPEVKRKKCPVCGTEVEIDAVKCNYCNSVLE